MGKHSFYSNSIVHNFFKIGYPSMPGRFPQNKPNNQTWSRNSPNKNGYYKDFNNRPRQNDYQHNPNFQHQGNQGARPKFINQTFNRNQPRTNQPNTTQPNTNQQQRNPSYAGYNQTGRYGNNKNQQNPSRFYYRGQSRGNYHNKNQFPVNQSDPRSETVTSPQYSAVQETTNMSQGQGCIPLAPVAPGYHHGNQFFSPNGYHSVYGGGYYTPEQLYYKSSSPTDHSSNASQATYTPDSNQPSQNMQSDQAAQSDQTVQSGQAIQSGLVIQSAQVIQSGQVIQTGQPIQQFGQAVSANPSPSPSSVYSYQYYPTESCETPDSLVRRMSEMALGNNGDAQRQHTPPQERSPTYSGPTDTNNNLNQKQTSKYTFNSLRKFIFVFCFSLRMLACFELQI